MKLIAGLGNPGPKYAGSRHNVGFMVVDELARRWGADVSRYESRMQGQVGRTEHGGETVIFLKPQTYMNLSGQSVTACSRFYKIGRDDVLVIYDDIDLPLGALRLRGSGTAGGHRGLDDVIRHFSSEDVPRLRVGIGKVAKSETVDHVLGRFDADERPVMDAAITTAADAAGCWIEEGLTAAMNRFNRKKE